MTRLILAIQFLTRLPTPQVREFRPELLAQSAGYFPVVGLLIGGLLVLLLQWFSHDQAWIAAWVGVAFWVWVTGGLHLDGLADVSDALGAAHRDPERLLAVMKDPHLGSFGVLSLLVAVSGKLVLLSQLILQQQWLALILIPAWARFAVYRWQTLPPLGTGGLAEKFSWSVGRGWFWGWLVILVGLSAWWCPVLILTPVVIELYRAWLSARVGGVSGDCLGAGIEVVELAMLLSAAISYKYIHIYV